MHEKPPAKVPGDQRLGEGKQKFTLTLLCGSPYQQIQPTMVGPPVPDIFFFFCGYVAPRVTCQKI